MTHITIPEVNKEALQYVFDKIPAGCFQSPHRRKPENFPLYSWDFPLHQCFHHRATAHRYYSSFEEISKEGEQGRKRLNRWTRWLTFPLAFLQSYGMITLLNTQAQVPIIENLVTQ